MNEDTKRKSKCSFKGCNVIIYLDTDFDIGDWLQEGYCKKHEALL